MRRTPTLAENLCGKLLFLEKSDASYIQETTVYLSDTACVVIAWFSGPYSNARAAWLCGLLSSSIHDTLNEIYSWDEIFFFEGKYDFVPERNYDSPDKGMIFLSEDESSASKMNNLARRIEHLFERL